MDPITFATDLADPLLCAAVTHLRYLWTFRRRDTRFQSVLALLEEWAPASVATLNHGQPAGEHAELRARTVVLLERVRERRRARAAELSTVT